ncbi:MAG: phosphotransferase [Actinobacteria bacterium]|nr:phosphotransferase [Actinomycetota bacterium]
MAPGETARPNSVGELLTHASAREPVAPSDGKSTSTFERVTIGGDRYFLKRVSAANDWVMRVSGDRFHRPYLVWQAGIMDRAPACIDHAVVAMQTERDGDVVTLLILMRDVARFLVPEGDSRVPHAQHEHFVDHLAQLAASFWGFTDTTGQLNTMAERLCYFDADHVAQELAATHPPGPIVAADMGWRALRDRSPALAELARVVHAEPGHLTEPLAATPATFVHGDWKMGNLGSHPDGRTILLDWAFPGSGPACWDLCWYLALNRARLPESKDATIARYRAALTAHGVDVTDWFDAQLDLCLIGMMVTFGWEKALGDGDELQWWERRVGEAVRRRGLDLPQAGG